MDSDVETKDATRKGRIQKYAPESTLVEEVLGDKSLKQSDLCPVFPGSLSFSLTVADDSVPTSQTSFFCTCSPSLHVSRILGHVRCDTGQ